MTAIWSELADAFERFFVVSPVLREHPRPDFDQGAYLERMIAMGSPAFSVLLAAQAAFPRGLRSVSAATPEGRADVQPAIAAPPTDIVEALAAAEVGATIVSGDGGAGKTTTLRQTAARQAATKVSSQSSRLPILVSLKGYGGNIDRLIHQAIDVVHGSWRSLPGEYSLLLDGLNEVSPGLLPQLERDLEALPWSRTAAAVTVRPSGTSSPVIMRELRGSLKLLEPSLSAVRQIAAGILDSGEVPAFIAALYPRMASGRRGFLRLPFGIHVAASVFHDHGELPESRHDLIWSYLQRRFERNHENSRSVLGDLADLPLTSVISLAERVSFETFVGRNVRQLPEDEMLEIFSLALRQLQEQRVFGSADIRELDVSRLLVHYEFLNVDALGGYSLPHDILVSWLSSGQLAKSWRGETSSLQTKRCDEAWLFAAPRIADSELDEFLDLMLGTDILLAAECAVELGASAKAKVEMAALRDLAVAGLPRRIAAYALGILGTDAAINALVAELPASWEQSMMTFPDVAGSLCAAGHSPTIDAILEEADRQGSNSGITVSGGEIALWEGAAIPEALVAARKRVDSVASEQGIFKSLSQIGAFGDDSDIHRLQSVIGKAPDISILARAVRALSQLDPEAGKIAAEDIWREASTTERGYFAHVYRRVAGKIDVKWALDVVAHGASADDPASNHSVVGAAAELLAEIQLENEARRRLEEEFAARTPANAWALWSVVKHHPSNEAQEAALAAVADSKPEEIGYACNYAATCELYDDFHEEFRKALLVQLRCEPELLHGWEGDRAFAYLLATGRRQDAATLVEEALALLRGAKGGESGFRLQDLIEIAGEIPEHLRRETLRQCLFVADGFSGPKKESLVRLATQLTATERDQLLEEAPSHCERAKLLGVFAGFPQTASSLGHLESTLNATLPFDHIAIGQLKTCIKNWWSDDVAAIVARALASAEFRRGGGYSDTLTDCVAKLLTRSQFERYVLPLTTPELHDVPRGTFQWWDQVTLYSRKENEEPADQI